MNVLGIETSCDETAVALLHDDRILASIVASQDEVHAPFGGVVPELASRRHLELILPTLRAALDRSGTSLDQVDALAVTSGPGLVVCLLIGLSLARALAFTKKLPLVGVNHLEGHLMAIFAEKTIPFPFVGLVVSGGHTSLYRVEGWGRYALLGQTLDDAAGEAFDKVAKLLGLPYPGGREIDALARQGNPAAVAFPRGLLKDGYNFSFSGLKTAVLRHVERGRDLEAARADIAASFQEAVVEVLVMKAVKAAQEFKVQDLVVSGGVASNRRLREQMSAYGIGAGLKVHFPSPALCTDNAVMIAGVGREKLQRGLADPADLLPRAVWPLGSA
jgi:N6-L-threonylcarbamoyladenine synthase